MNINSFCQEHRTENARLYVRMRNEESKRSAGFKEIGEICPVCMAVLITAPALPGNIYCLEDISPIRNNLQEIKAWKMQPQRYVTKPSNGLKKL